MKECMQEVHESIEKTMGEPVKFPIVIGVYLSHESKDKAGFYTYVDITMKREMLTRIMALMLKAANVGMEECKRAADHHGWDWNEVYEEIQRKAVE